MPEVEHEVAVYYDTRGKRCTLRFESLASNQTFAESKSLELYDESEQVRVYPRDNARGRRHFYSESTGLRRFDRGESGPEHNKRVADILTSLDKLSDGWHFAYQGYAGNPLQSLFGSMTAYTWGSEVTRILNQGAAMRHDVYGDLGIRMSPRRPAIAIEVVNSHYPEEATFSALIEQTLRAPLAVLFDFTHVSRDKLVIVDEAAQALIYRSYTFLIAEGSVWLGQERRRDIDSSARLKIEAGQKYKGWK